jgi:23S rRNA (guanine2445-N2)-methyltransferase / 23S rRNA (guanine2069-N7)-methyltransferase
VQRDEATLSLDLSGESLHRRGYRAQGTPAPLKETLAAAILLYAGWPEHARAAVPLLDPMCGSGTLPIEAGLIAADRAPGLLRSYWGFAGWRGHDPAVWQALLDEAHARAEAAPRKLPTIRGFDLDGAAVRAANENLERAGLRGRVHIERRALEALEPSESVESATGSPRGILVVNPPYGERIGDEKELEGLYQQLGDLLRRKFPGWTGWVFTGNPELGKKIGLRPARRHVLWNGPIECRLLEIPIASTPVKDAEGPGWRKPKRTSGAEGFANRLAKNWKHLRKWAKREDVSCWRVYDADLVEYAVAVDLYENAVHVQEYEPPATVDPQMAEARLDDILQVVPEVLGVDPKDVFLKVRRRQRGREQYERQGFSGAVRTVREAGYRFEVNLSDYLDTGLFLDHRRVRAMVAELAPQKRFLNLFAYTGTASVYAAKAGAKSTLSVDLSHTYLEWAARNFKLNSLPERDNRLERADVLTWLPRAAEENQRFGLIFLAPPTFSNSKSMTDTLDIQRDHVEILRATAALLEPDGVLVFSNHFRRFKLDEAALPHLVFENLTHKTLPEDFKRNPRIHNSWKIILRK